MRSELLIGAAILCLAASSARAAVLYSDGETVGTNSAYALFDQTNPDAVIIAASFKLTANSTVTGVNFGAWVLADELLTDVNWAVYGDPSAAALFSGTATTSSFFLLSNAQGFDVYEAHFSLPSVDLEAGAYFLGLGQAGNSSPAASGDAEYWDISGGASSLYQTVQGYLDCTSCGPAFNIVGSVDPTTMPPNEVPEPSTMALLVSGILGIAARRWGTRRGKTGGSYSTRPRPI